MQETFRKSFLKSGNAEGSFNFILHQGPKTQMPKGPARVVTEVPK